MFSYSVVEQALAGALDLQAEERPAFAARLRHLRNLGLPRRKPGTGKRLAYAVMEVREIFLALLLEAMGCSPRISVEIVKSVSQRNAGAPPHLIAILPEGRVASTTAERAMYLLGSQPVSAFLNVSRACEKLDKHLRLAA